MANAFDFTNVTAQLVTKNAIASDQIQTWSDADAIACAKRARMADITVPLVISDDDEFMQVLEEAKDMYSIDVSGLDAGFVVANAHAIAVAEQFFAGNTAATVVTAVGVALADTTGPSFAVADTSEFTLLMAIVYPDYAFIDAAIMTEWTDEFKGAMMAMGATDLQVLIAQAGLSLGSGPIFTISSTNDGEALADSYIAMWKKKK